MAQIRPRNLSPEPIYADGDEQKPFSPQPKAVISHSPPKGNGMATDRQYLTTASGSASSPTPRGEKTPIKPTGGTSSREGDPGLGRHHPTASPCEDDITQMVEPPRQAGNTSAGETPSREGDPGLGRHHPTASPCEDDIPPEVEPPRQVENTVDKPEDPFCDTTFFDRLSRLLSPILIVIASVLGCYVFSNIASFCKNLRTLSCPERILFTIPIVIFSCILLYMIGKIWKILRQLKTFTQISGRALQELREREELRRLSIKRDLEAQKQLRALLLSSDTTAQEEFLKKLAPDEAEQIHANRKILLQEDCHCTSQEWIGKFLKNYQARLDKIAEARISHYSWRAAAWATTSPFPALDQLIVLATCVTLLKELFQIYNLKPKWDKNLLLMARIVIHVYVTGFWQQLAGAGAEALVGGIESVLPTIAEKTAFKALNGAGHLVPDIYGSAFRVVTKAGGEFIAHKITVSRLGAAAIRVLQPVAKV